MHVMQSIYVNSIANMTPFWYCAQLCFTVHALLKTVLPIQNTLWSCACNARIDLKSIASTTHFWYCLLIAHIGLIAANSIANTTHFWYSQAH